MKIHLPPTQALRWASLCAATALLSLRPASAQTQMPLSQLTPLSQSAPTYRLAASWPLAGEGFWDYLTVDGAAHRLYIPRDDRIQVVDTRTGALIGQVPGLEEAHGVALVPALNLGFATSGGQNSVVVFDLKTLARVGAPIRVGEGPDAVAYEPVTRQLFTMNGDGKSTSVIDAKSRRVVATIALGTNAESAVPNGAGHLFINLEGSSQIAEVDARTRKLLHKWPLAPGEEPTGLSYDAKTGRLFAGCRNQKLVVLDAHSGQVVAAIPIGKGVDAGAFDPQLGLSFSPNGRDGTLSIVSNKGAKPALVATLATHKGARTMALDAQNHAIYVVAADYQPLQPGQRYPQAVPGTTVVLKYELGAPGISK